MIEKGRRFLARKFGVRIKDLHYIGATDCSFMSEGAFLMQYNIMDINHVSFQSTVAYKYGY